MRILERGRRERSRKKIFEDIWLKIPQIWWKALIYTSEKFSKAQEEWPQRDPNTHTSYSKAKYKRNIWKQQEKKLLNTYQGTLNKLTNTFLSETMEASKQWDDIFKMLREIK